MGPLPMRFGRVRSNTVIVIEGLQCKTYRFQKHDFSGKGPLTHSSRMCRKVNFRAPAVEKMDFARNIFAGIFCRASLGKARET